MHNESTYLFLFPNFNGCMGPRWISTIYSGNNYARGNLIRDPVYVNEYDIWSFYLHAESSIMYFIKRFFLQMSYFFLIFRDHFMDNWWFVHWLKYWIRLGLLFRGFVYLESVLEHLAWTKIHVFLIGFGSCLIEQDYNSFNSNPDVHILKASRNFINGVVSYFKWYTGSVTAYQPI